MILGFLPRNCDMTAVDKYLNVLIIAGEASGDQHAGHLVRHLKELAPRWHLSGIGGHKFQEAGGELLVSYENLAVTGISELLKKAKKIWQAYRKLVIYIRREPPDLAILLDYPDFNLRMAKVLRRRDVPIVYYISPQVWAWRESRVSQIKKLVDKLFVIFPFEVPFYKRHGVEATFLGHPLLDDISCSEVGSSCHSEGESPKNLSVPDDFPRVCLLPGSRKNEISALLPDMLRAVSRIQRILPRVQFVLHVAPGLNQQWLEKFIIKEKVPVTMTFGDLYNALSISDVALVCSGTATLQTGLMECPMVIVYKVGWLTYILGKILIRKIRNFGIVNVILGRTVVPELLQEKASSENMAKEIISYLVDPRRKESVAQELRTLKNQLGDKGASARVAQEIVSFMETLPLLKEERKSFPKVWWSAALCYGLAIKIRALLYRRGILKSRKLPAKVVSIGNMTWGGNGKTPFTMLLMEWLKNSGKKAAIVSRGYGGKLRERALVKVPSRNMEAAKEFGDEPVLLSKKGDFPVIVGKNRWESGKWGIENLGVNYLVLDDGFQHWRLHRDMDIVLHDVAQPLENNSLIPLGTLREPREGLARADFLVLTRVNEVSPEILRQMRRNLDQDFSDLPRAEMIYEPISMRHLDLSVAQSLESYRGKKFYLMAGIARPGSFRHLVQTVGQVVGHQFYRDHYPYSQGALYKVQQGALAVGADFILTTEKDAVRINPSWLTGIPSIRVLEVSLKFVTGENEFFHFMKSHDMVLRDS